MQQQVGQQALVCMISICAIKGMHCHLSSGQNAIFFFHKNNNISSISTKIQYVDKCSVIKCINTIHSWFKLTRPFDMEDVKKKAEISIKMLNVKCH